MTTLKGPGIFLAQFMGDAAPFNNLQSICLWAESLGFKGVQIPTWDARCIDLQKAAESKTYCDDLRGTAAAAGVQISELSTHLQGQLVAVHPAYASMFQVFAPADVNTPQAMCDYGSEQVRLCLKASANLGLSAMPTFSGALMWHTVYPWPQRPTGLVEAGFKELARRWRPILDYADECGVDCAFEVPGPATRRHSPSEQSCRASAFHPDLPCKIDLLTGYARPADPGRSRLPTNPGISSATSASYT